MSPILSLVCLVIGIYHVKEVLSIPFWIVLGVFAQIGGWPAWLMTWELPDRWLTLSTSSRAGDPWPGCATVSIERPFFAKYDFRGGDESRVH